VGRKRGRPATSHNSHHALVPTIIRATGGGACNLTNSSNNKSYCFVRLACPVGHERCVQVRSVYRCKQRAEKRQREQQQQQEGTSGITGELGAADLPCCYCKVCDEPKGGGEPATQHEQRAYSIFRAHYANLPAPRTARRHCWCRMGGWLVVAPIFAHETCRVKHAGPECVREGGMARVWVRGVKFKISNSTAGRAM